MWSVTNGLRKIPGTWKGSVLWGFREKELGTISENEPIKMNPSTWLVCHMNDDQKTPTRKKLSVFRYLSHFHRQWVHESRSMEKALG